MRDGTVVQAVSVQVYFSKPRASQDKGKEAEAEADRETDQVKV
jgi:hypothetical protein